MSHLPAFVDKMKQAGLDRIVTDTFAYYYEQLASQKTGKIPEACIGPVPPESVPDARDLTGYEAAGNKRMGQAVMIVLNGGLGTSMGLTGPKSLIEVKDGRSFLDINLAQAAERNVRLVFMNSFSTHKETLAAVSRIAPPRPPLFFLQHKFPKVLKDDLSPAKWPDNPELEWNPPGHGDIYTALYTSGMLEVLLKEGVTYAFIANADNLGATLDPSLLGYFAANDLPFMMETAERTPADVKGGHLARRCRDGRLVLRESAQCPDQDKDAFQDIRRYRYFNTNNLWVNLKQLNRLIETEKKILLPMILNEKHLNPRDGHSPRVYQIETAMGTAVGLFDNAAAIKTRPSRFFPVKKCDDLLAVRSDCFILTKAGGLTMNPDRGSGRIQISLDPNVYDKIDTFDRRFSAGTPSLVDCTSLTVRGDVAFGAKVKIRGRVTITNKRSTPVEVQPGAIITRDLVFDS